MVRSADLLRSRPGNAGGPGTGTGTGAGTGAGEVAMPRVYIQIKGWWNGGKCSVSPILTLLMREVVGNRHGSVC